MEPSLSSTRLSLYTKGSQKDTSVLADFVTALLGIFVSPQSRYFAICCSTSSTINILLLLIDNTPLFYECEQHPTACLDNLFSGLGCLEPAAYLLRSHCDTCSFACMLSVLGG